MKLHPARREKELLSSQPSKPEIQEAMMNVRFIASPVLVLMLSHYAPAQQMPRGVDEAGPARATEHRRCDEAKYHAANRTGRGSSAAGGGCASIECRAQPGVRAAWSLVSERGTLGPV